MDTPSRSPNPRIQANPDLKACLIRTAVTDGPVRNAPIATTSPTTSRVRSASLMNRTNVSKMTAAALLGSALFGTLLR